jgi:hypothetical protein
MAGCHPVPGAPRSPASLSHQLAALASLLLGVLGTVAPAVAGVRFENCVTAPDGSITCDTVPTGNTLTQDIDSRYGLLDNASPGWSEFDPYAGYEDDFGGNQT